MQQSFMTQAAYARRCGVSRKAVSTWKAKGLLVLDDAGRLVDTVATDRRLADQPSHYRGGRTAEGVTLGNTTVTLGNNPDSAAVTSASEAEGWSLAEATRRKEIQLALLRELEYDQKSGQVVLVEDAVMLMTSELLIVRNRLLGLPNKMAPVVSRLGVEQARDALHKEIVTILTELSSAKALVMKAGGKIDPTSEKHI